MQSDEEAQVLYDLKHIDFTKYHWPEVNPIDLQMPDYKSGGKVCLQNYRYPTNQDTRKGIIQLLHGLGDYIGRYAFLAKKLSDQGYDVVGIDQRGFGYSEGRRGLVESQQIIRDDILTYTSQINEKFGGKDVPHFSIGNSLGGTIQLMISSEAPETFKGMTLIVPFTGLGQKAKETFGKLRTFAKVANIFAPTYQIKLDKPKDQPWLDNFRNDPISESYKVCAHNLLETDRISQIMFTEIIPKV